MENIHYRIVHASDGCCYAIPQGDEVGSGDITEAINSAIASGIVTSYVKPQNEEVTATHSNITGGSYFAPEIVDRENGSQIVCLPVGSIICLKCSSTFKNIIGKDYIECGDVFVVTNKIANNGTGPYIMAVFNGNIDEVTSISQELKKKHLGAGRYMALNAADFTSKKSWVLVQKIDADVD